MFQERPTVAEIDLGALLHNYRALSACAGAAVEVIPVVKADAYGHGALPVASWLARNDAVPAFAVATVNEARSLKSGGIREPILILGALYEEDIAFVLKGGIVPVIWDLETAKRLSEAACRLQKKIPVEVKIDTGMGRAGVPAEEAVAFLFKVENLPGLRLKGLLSHLAVADGEREWERRYTDRQAYAFSEICRIFVPEDKKRVPVCHLANSAGIVRYDFPGCRRARAGIALYGAYPDPGLEDKIDLRPVMRVKTGIVLLKRLQPGQSVSYGCTYTAREEMVVGLLPIGYADGYNRLLSGRGEVLVRGRRAPIIGRVCMDWTMIELTDIPEAAIGDEVVVLGRQGEEEIRAEEMADRVGTISYEIFCNFSPRVPRVYIDGA
jgi:alanine racemase